MPRVLNRRDPATFAAPNTVYVGRPSFWGNPFVVGRNGVRDRHDAIARFRQWLVMNPARVDRCRRELRGKDLVCWCAPLPCHADVLLEVANG